MPNLFLSWLAARWKAVLWSAVACLIGLSYLGHQTRKLAEDNGRMVLERTAPEAGSAIAQRLALVEKENEQLRADLASIPTLAATHDGLRQQLTEQASGKADAWAGCSNLIAAAIAQKREELTDTYRRSSEEQHRKAREIAAERLADKASEESQEPAQEDDQLKERLQQVGLSIKQLVDLRKERAAADNTEETKAAFRARFKKAAMDRMRALEDLGKDQVLYETLPLPPTIEDAAKVPVLRSILPDRHGLSATVYLDGTVILARANP